MESYTCTVYNHVQCFVTGFFHYVDTPHLFVHELVDKHLSCFHLWDIMNNATLNICVEKNFVRGKTLCLRRAETCSKWAKNSSLFP